MRAGLSGALVLLALTSLTAHAGDAHDFGNWHVFCDNGGTCVVLADAAAQAAYLSIVFESGREEPVGVRLAFGALDDTPLRRRDLSVAFEGEAGDPRTVDTARQTEDDFFRFALPAERAAAFVDRLPAGGTLRLELSAPNAPYYAASIDLEQAKEALDWARAEAKPATVPVLHVKVAPQGSVADVLPDSVAASLPEACAGDAKAPPDANAMRLSETSVVWRVRCVSEGTQRFYVLDTQTGATTSVKFPGPNGADDAKETAALGPNAYLDAANMAIFDEEPRDCPNVGVSGDEKEWVWTGAGFELAFIRSAPICLDTGDWPYLYRTEVVAGP
jgi:hypothetical protein